MPAELNVFSKSSEPLARALSNFAHTPFELDGVQYASVEAFYQSLKFEDPYKRAEIALLWGNYAKAAAKKAEPAKHTTYMGTTISLGSDEHYALLERAIRAKLEQNPVIMRVFSESKSRPIVHETGMKMKPQTDNSPFPSHVFTRLLTEIRDSLMIEPRSNPIEFDLFDLSEIEVDGGRSDQIEPSAVNTITGGILELESPPLFSVTDCLSRITDERFEEWHDLSGWAKAFEGFQRRVSAMIGGGSDSLAFRLENGDVLKIHSRQLEPAAGTRPFDLPILEREYLMFNGIPIHFFIQPYAMRPLAIDLREVGQTISQSGYHFSEPFLNQIGRWKGRPYLIDPWAVVLKTHAP